MRQVDSVRVLLRTRYAAAESDCSMALVLDDSYVKAYLRRGTARAKLGKLAEALEGKFGCLEFGNLIDRPS